MGVLEGRSEELAQALAAFQRRIDEAGASDRVLVITTSEFGRRVAENGSGGTDHGKCEVDKEKDCAWTLIYRRLEKMGKLDNIRKDFPPRNHLAQSHPAKQVHEVYKGE